MRTDHHSDRDSRHDADRAGSDAWTRLHRILLAVAAVVYVAWWIIVDRVLPHAFNPIGGRLAIVASFLVVLGLTYVSPLARRHVSRLHAACAIALTLHYYYLFANNAGDPNWVIGSYITVVAVGLTLLTLESLVVYAAVVMVAAWRVGTTDPAAAVALPGLVTVLVLLAIVAALRAKADGERQRRIQAEAAGAALAEVSRAKSLFLANVSHELRTPLTSVIGYGDLLADAPELTPESRAFLERVRANARALMETVSQILRLTEADFGHPPVDAAPLDLRALVARQVAEITPAAEAKGLRVTLVADDPRGTRVAADGASLERILRNVLANAVKFTQRGEIAVTLRAEAARRTGFAALTLTVRDSGIGIAPGDVERVFDPFRQVEEEYSRSFGGIGLGLTIARKIARAMGGDVTIEASAPGDGTTVRIQLEAPMR
jgi:signal transduction histidine kinase